ncbi:SpaH/EbpB family LPXTG-anchored major pilin [Corynebacterium glutamicum]|uniref:Gram-positive cocci surface proteins LPxTG domain-containing protein n=1 Tax=Corynebacterium glutamicum (strain R) TaxID=340322 RepID=A0AB72VEK4_CORGB|nr:SpaH/EbpB family LPXTG-anchored major pilin [Corynebacterium glutamicum]BAF55808.1 hypothetical protein cgR_2789 [Corynebacterium glutamicum R]
MNPTPKRISAAVLSLALGFTIAGAPILAPVASAQITADAVSSIDLDADVSLTIHKRLGEPDPNGDPTNAPGTALPNIQFRIEKVDLNNELDTLAGWSDLNTLQANAAGELDALIDAAENTGGKTTVATISTGTTGTATIDQSTPDFGVGVYLVTEIQNGNYTVAKPFLVTLPFADADGLWDYNQVVAPKNQVVSVSKDVADPGATIGSTINYTARASVPADDLDRFIVIDNLPTVLAVPADTDVVVESPADIELTEGTDYTLTITGQEVRVEFLPAGLTNLEVLRANDSELEVLVKFPSQIIGLPTDGIIRNDIEVLLPNDGRVTTDPTDPDNPGNPEDGAETHLGMLTINKVDDEDLPITADTASFQLWRCQDQAGRLQVTGSPLFGSNSLTIDDTPASHQINEFITVDGVATAYGVQVYNFVNGATPAVGVNDQLCVVETEAPEGYVLNPEPQAVSFDTDTADPFDMVVNVTNLEDTLTGQLPATGGNGTMILIGAGVLVAAAGGAAAVRGNRARKN